MKKRVVSKKISPIIPTKCIWYPCLEIVNKDNNLSEQNVNDEQKRIENVFLYFWIFLFDTLQIIHKNKNPSDRTIPSMQRTPDVLSRDQVECLSSSDVHTVIGSVMLADGFPFVLDLEKSHDSYIHDSKTNKEYLGNKIQKNNPNLTSSQISLDTSWVKIVIFYSHPRLFLSKASYPVGHNHPKLSDPEFLQSLAKIAIHNPSNSDIYTLPMAQFVATFRRVAMPKEFVHLFFVQGGALAVENAMKTAFDWKGENLRVLWVVCVFLNIA